MGKQIALVLGAAGLVLGVASGSARADERRLKDPFVRPVDSEAIRALPPAKLKDPFTRRAPARAIARLSEARLKDPFARPERPEELPVRRLKDPFAR